MLDCIKDEAKRRAIAAFMQEVLKHPAAWYAIEQFNSVEKLPVWRHSQRVGELLAAVIHTLPSEPDGATITLSDLGGREHLLPIAGLLHDLGKTKIDLFPDKADLSPDERAILQSHVRLGIDMVNEAGLFPAADLADVDAFIGLHHENGPNPYPRCGGPRSSLLPYQRVCGGLLGVCDQFDAMHRDYSREYRTQPLSLEETCSLLISEFVGHPGIPEAVTSLFIGQARSRKLSVDLGKRSALPSFIRSGTRTLKSRSAIAA